MKACDLDRGGTRTSISERAYESIEGEWTGFSASLTWMSCE